MTSVTPLSPRGHYIANEVGRLAGVSGQTIGQWARRGYIRSSQSSDTPRVYSFQDVAEAMVVHELLERDVAHRDIRRAIEELRSRYGHDWPLTGAQLATSSGRVLAEADSATYDIGKRGWQQMNTEDLARIVDLLERGGWAARDLPNLRYIEVNPDRLSGRPVIRGKRVPVEVVAELAIEPDGAETLHAGYDVTDAEITDAREWWRATEAFAAAA